MIIVIGKAAPIKKIPIWDYSEFRDRLSGAILSKSVHPSIDSLFAYGTSSFNLTEDVVAEHLENFMLDLSRRL